MRALLSMLVLAASLSWSAPATAQGACGFSPYGVGLGGANVGTLSGSGPLTPGSVLVLDLQDFTMGPAFGLIAIAQTQVAVPVLGGTLLVNALAPLSLHSVWYDVFAQSVIPVPPSPAIVGVTVYAQAGLVFPVTGGFEFSQGLAMTICP